MLHYGRIPRRRDVFLPPQYAYSFLPVALAGLSERYGPERYGLWIDCDIRALLGAAPWFPVLPQM